MAADEDSVAASEALFVALEQRSRGISHLRAWED
jgi:hypothetical protein